MNPESSLARIRVVLCMPSHPGNIGACARAMKTMGISDLRMVAPHAFPHPKAVARASGAIGVLNDAKVSATLDDALRGAVLAVGFTARRRELAAPLAAPREAAAEVVSTTRFGDVALVFGNERSGLDNESLARCQLLVTIPTDASYGSLNLAAAVQVICYELRLAAQSPVVTEAHPQGAATLDEIEHMLAHFERAMIASGFLDPLAPRRLMARLRRMFGRIRLEKEEVAILRGMLASLEAKVD